MHSSINEKWKHQNRIKQISHARAKREFFKNKLQAVSSPFKLREKNAKMLSGQLANPFPLNFDHPGFFNTYLNLSAWPFSHFAPILLLRSNALSHYSRWPVVHATRTKGSDPIRFKALNNVVFKKHTAVVGANWKLSLNSCSRFCFLWQMNLLYCTSKYTLMTSFLHNTRFWRGIQEQAPEITFLVT